MCQPFFPGKKAWYASDSPTAQFTAIFEDEGDTGYFYAYDRAGGVRVLDAMHIYNVTSVVDKDRESVAEIVWSLDGLKAILLINDYPHAIIDFSERRSYCRTAFPSPPSNWYRGEWSEELLKLFPSLFKTEYSDGIK
jgi:hypothetical protein